MPATTAQTFYPAKVTQDQTLTGASSIYGFAETAPAVDATSTLAYSSTTAASLTVRPYAANTTSGDTTGNYGWALGNGSGSAGSYLASTATAQRTIPAGVWSAAGTLGFSAPALLQTISATVNVEVYRVAVGGGARTVLFTMTAAAVTNTAAGTKAWSAASASQPQITLAAGEAIEVGYLVSSAATSVLGSTTATTLTFYAGAGANGSLSVSVPAPGIRTLYMQSPSDMLTLADSPARSAAHPRVLTDSVAVSDALSRQTTAGRASADTLSFSDAAMRSAAHPRVAADTTGTSDVSTRTTTFTRAELDTLTVSDTPARRYLGSRTAADTLTLGETPQRAIIYGRTTRDYPPGVTPDYPITFPTRSIASCASDANGNHLAGVTVDLFRVVDKQWVQTTTTDSNGNWSFPRDTYDPYTYWAEVHQESASPQVHGMTDRPLTPS